MNGWGTSRSARWAVAGALALGAALGGCTPGAGSAGEATTTSTARPSVSGSTSHSATPHSSGVHASDGTTSADPSGLEECGLDTLPPETEDTIDAIRSGGPYVARKDGVTFGNRERILPSKPQGFYREYTVVTPRSDDRGARRVVTGGSPKTDPQWYFYTGDHYDSFCQITGLG